MIGRSILQRPLAIPQGHFIVQKTLLSGRIISPPVSGFSLSVNGEVATATPRGEVRGGEVVLVYGHPN
jgi:hypothetical protein